MMQICEHWLPIAINNIEPAIGNDWQRQSLMANGYPP